MINDSKELTITIFLESDFILYDSIIFLVTSAKSLVSLLEIFSLSKEDKFK